MTVTPDEIAALRAKFGPPPPPDPEDVALCESGECGGCTICWGPGIPLVGKETVLPLLDEIERLRRLGDERAALIVEGEGAPILPSTAQPTEYRLSLLPEEHDDWHLYLVTVIRSLGDWFVLRGTPSSPSNRFLHADGTWVTGSWPDAPSYDLATALRLADEALPRLTYHGKTARDVLAERGEAGTDG